MFRETNKQRPLSKKNKFDIFFFHRAIFFDRSTKISLESSQKITETKITYNKRTGSPCFDDLIQKENIKTDSTYLISCCLKLSICAFFSFDVKIYEFLLRSHVIPSLQFFFVGKKAFKILFSLLYLLRCKSGRDEGEVILPR